MRRRILVLALLFCGALVAGSAAASATTSTSTSAARSDQTLRVVADRAPVDPDGDLAGAPTDIVVTFKNIDPAVPGVGLKAGGTIAITLAEEFVDNGTRPFAATGSSPTCAPPLISSCNTAVIVQGWPQSPVLPFPGVAWDSSTNTVTLTALADWFPAGPSSPGPKAVHLALFGFSNPERPGAYWLDLEIRPDPDVDHVITGRGRVIIKGKEPSLSPISLAAGAPPPPFPNPLFQTAEAGDSSLPLLLYMADREAEAIVGATFVDGPARVRPIRSAAGRRIGLIRVTPPARARNWSLSSGGPSTAASAFLSGAPVGVMTSVLTTDPVVSGKYRIFYRMYGGDSFSQVIDVAAGGD